MVCPCRVARSYWMGFSRCTYSTSGIWLASPCRVPFAAWLAISIRFPQWCWLRSTVPGLLVLYGSLDQVGFLDSEGSLSFYRFALIAWLAYMTWLSQRDWLARAPWVYDSVSSSTMARLYSVVYSLIMARSVVMVSSLYWLALFQWFPM